MESGVNVPENSSASERPEWEKKAAVIFDMDGTLVDVSSVRHYVREALLPDGTYAKGKNFDAFHRASLFCPAIWSTVDKLQYYWEKRLDILIVTARGEQYRQTTKDWLHKYAIPHNKLFMRPWGDNRPDVDVKREILAEIERDWNVMHAVDDNPSIIALWHEHQIPTTIVPGWED